MTVLSPLPTLPVPGLSSLCLAILDRSPLPMAAVQGPNHIICYANPAFCQLASKSGAQLLAKSFCEIFPERKECIAQMASVLRTGKPETQTQSGTSNSHSNFWSLTMWPVLADEAEGGVLIQVTETTQLHEKTLAMNEALMLGSVRQHELTAAADSANVQLQAEIAERKLVEQALQSAQARLTNRAGQLEELVAGRTSELTELNAQLEAFAYSIAHDLRAPLRAMQSFSAMLLEESGPSLNATGRDYATRIDKSARFMDSLLCDLLAFSRISQQRVELTTVDLKAVVDGVVHRLKIDIKEKNARVETTGPWPAVLAHELTLVQVLFNLVSNALKFTAPGVQPHIRIRAEERREERIDGLMDKGMSGKSSNNPLTHQSNRAVNPPSPPPPPISWARIWVEDNGVGIAPDYHAQIFKLFTRLLGDKYSGTGIGLAIVQKGIERMGGKAGVESEQGQGSKFWIELKKA
jgi:signal transduction histidine kinase